jgi:GntR family transcriptional regulator, rspAB operon transcriptional repressor
LKNPSIAEFGATAINSTWVNGGAEILRIDIAIKAGLNELVMSIRPQDSAAGLSAPLWNKAYYRIRERILRGEFSPGEALSARRLAEEFGMSLLPISQAFRQLESEKLLESRPRAGTRVRMPQPEEIRGRCIVREALEAQSARLCALNANMKERVELMRLAQQLDTLYDRFGQSGSDPELQYVVHTLHFELHMRVAEYARCEELKDAIERNQVLIYNWFFDLAANRRSLPSGFHAQLMQVVTGSDPIAADEAMRSHVQYGVPELLKQTILPTTNDWRLRRSQAGDKVGNASVEKPPATAAAE